MFKMVKLEILEIEILDAEPNKFWEDSEGFLKVEIKNLNRRRPTKWCYELWISKTVCLNPSCWYVCFILPPAVSFAYLCSAQTQKQIT